MVYFFVLVVYFWVFSWCIRGVFGGVFVVYLWGCRGVFVALLWCICGSWNIFAPRGVFLWSRGVFVVLLVGFSWCICWFLRVWVRGVFFVVSWCIFGVPEQ